MKVLIQHLGSIGANRQTIDLSKDFIVFVGENNSGKTYVAQLIWTIFNRSVQARFAENLKLDLGFHAPQTTVELSAQLINYILDEFALFLKKEFVATLNIREDIAQNTVLRDFSVEFVYEMDEIVEKEILSNYVLSIYDEEFSLYSIQKLKGELNCIIRSNEIGLVVPNDMQDYSIKDIENQIKADFIIQIIGLLLPQISSTFLPANRSFYPAFYQYIYEIERNRLQTLVTSGQTAFESFRAPYTQPVNELIGKLYKLNREQRVVGYYSDLLQKLQHLMGGSIQLNNAETVAMIDFSFKMNQQSSAIPMYVSSSSVNQLTLLALYLEYWAKKENNFLIIDEPEENLNPKNQIKLLELLLLFASANNNKALITTHSPLMAEAVNTYCYLYHLKHQLHFNPTELVSNENLSLINTEVSFDKEALGVYYFNGKAIIDYNSDDYGVLFRDFKQTEKMVKTNNKILSDYIYLAQHPTHE